MIAALYSSRPQGAKDFMRNNHQFGWQTIQKVFAEDLEKAENGLSRKVPGLKYAHVYRDNWTRLNVRPAKIMQVCTGCCGFLYKIIKTVSCINSDQSGKAISMDVNKWSAQASFHCLSARVTNYAM